MAASRATYSEDDDAKLYVVLTANDGNIKRTARETGVPESTLRRKRDQWAKEGPPRLEKVEEAAKDFVTEAVELRGMALGVLRQKIELLKKDPDKVKIAEVTTLMGVLTDKIDRAAGLGTRNQVDHFHHLPAPEELRALMEGFVESGQALAARRSEEIIEAELVEQPALPAGQK